MTKTACSMWSPHSHRYHSGNGAELVTSSAKKRGVLEKFRDLFLRGPLS
jgi:hypothetical protein